MANSESTTNRPPAPYSREGRYQQTVALLRDHILPSSLDLMNFSGTSVAEDKELFTLDYLRTCRQVPLPPTPFPPSPAPRKFKHRPIRQIKISSIGRITVEVPYVRLAGQWLREAGFQVGAFASVKVDGGRLLIEPVPVEDLTELVEG